MTEDTKTMSCANCGTQIVSVGGGSYTHVQYLEDHQTTCADPKPAWTITKPVTKIRRTTTAPFAALACVFSHAYRVVLERNQPIALECANCARTWKTELVEREQV